MLRLSLLLVACISAPAQQDTLQRIQDLEQRLARAEALIAQLLERQPAPTPIETVAPATPASTEVAQSQSLTNTRGMPQELLPKLGLIGASSNFTAGIHSGPYGGARGSFLSGGVALPLASAPGGQLLYEFSAGLSSSDTRLNVTSNVAQVANLAVLGSNQISDALAGTGASPFPVRIDTRSQLQLLQVTPFGLKYQNTALNRWRLRPYAVLGFGLYVTISNQTALTGLRADANLPPELRNALNTLFGNGAPFGGALIGGQLTAAKELTALGIPSGQGGISPGFQTGGGIEWRWKPRFSWGIDWRWNRLSSGASFYTLAPKGSFHF